MRYKCLVLDHDDTVVQSTAVIHYPALREALAVLRPNVCLSLEEYYAMNCAPGFAVYLKDVLGLSPEEIAFEHQCWVGRVAAHVPPVYAGMRELLERHKASGGFLCVVSHNLSEHVLRDYRANRLPEPDLIFGSDLPREQRKPSPYPLEEIQRRLNLSSADLLVVDDLIPGYEMAQAGHVDFAAACWGHATPQVRRYLEEKNARRFFSPADLRTWLRR